MKVIFRGVEKAFAKINVGLDICGVTEDGYHLLSTIMQTISLHDEVEIVCFPKREEKNRIQIITDGEDIKLPLDEKNTAFRAAVAFFRETGISHADIDIHLKKRIPSQAGLGGASADAAAVLRLLNRAFPDGFINHENRKGDTGFHEKLMLLALEIGADVPFCMNGGTCLCQGIGEKMRNLPDLPNLPILLLKPPIGISTPRAFSRYDELQEMMEKDKLNFGTQKAADLLDGTELSFRQAIPFFRNSLELPAIDLCNEIETCKHFLQKSGAAYVSMSGSGSCVFGVFLDEQKSFLAYKKARKEFEETFFISLASFYSSLALKRKMLI